MDWLQTTELLGNVGEFVGSIAILITLIYLAIQVRVVRTQLGNEFMSRVHEVYKADSLSKLNDPSLGELQREADLILSPEIINEIESSVFFVTLKQGGMEEGKIYRLRQYWQHHWLSVRELINLTEDESARRYQLAALAAYLSWGSGALWWKSTRESFMSSKIHAEMAENVQKLIEAQNGA